MLMYVLPFAFIFVIARFPTGLVLYWMTTNLWTVGQGLITRRLIPKTPPPSGSSAGGSKRSSRTPPKEPPPAPPVVEDGAKQQPGLDKSAVRFQVVSEGERGLLGVGYAPARVVATVSDAAAVAEPRDESALAAEVRELVERIADGIGVTGRVEAREDDEAITL